MELIFAILVLMTVAGAAGMLGLLHRQVPPGDALVIGRGAAPRIVTRGAAFALPLLQRVRVLELGLVTLDVEAPPSATPDGEPLHVRAAAVVRVGEGPERLRAAAGHFAGKTADQREAVLHGILARAVHEAVDGLSEEAITTGGPDLAARATAIAAPELASVGCDMVTLTITEGRAGGV